MFTAELSTKMPFFTLNSKNKSPPPDKKVSKIGRFSPLCQFRGHYRIEANGGSCRNGLIYNEALILRWHAQFRTCATVFTSSVEDFPSTVGARSARA